MAFLFYANREWTPFSYSLALTLAADLMSGRPTLLMRKEFLYRSFLL
jgi:hypothetical protein